MEAALLALVGFGLVLAAVAIAVASGTERTAEERPVLPSGYASLLYADHSRYPGHCTSCGTDNEPGYRFCEACGSQIPTTDVPSSGTDVRSIVDE